MLEALKEKTMIEKLMSGSLVLQIGIGIVAGVALSQISPSAAGSGPGRGEWRSRVGWK